MPCEQKVQLVELYRVAVANYYAAVSDLNLTRGKTSKTEYARLLSSAEAARMASEAARLGLGRHIKNHGC